MKDIYNYKENIKGITTINGDKVISMNKEILTTIIVALFEVRDAQRADGREATAEETEKLIDALMKAE